MNKDYDALAKKILPLIGGANNVKASFHCATRLRIMLYDKKQVNLSRLKQLNVLGAQFVGNQLQVVIGPGVDQAYDAFEHSLQKKSADKSSEFVNTIPNENVIKKTLDSNRRDFGAWFKNSLTEFISCIVPMIPLLIGAGLIKSGILVAQQLNLATAKTPTIVTLTFVVDAAFYFMPVYLAAFTARHFKSNMALAMLMGAMLIHPDFISSVAAGHAGSVFGLPIYPANYVNSILPSIISVWLMGKVEYQVAKHSPEVIRNLLVPLVTLLIMIPVTLCAVAPIGLSLAGGFQRTLSTSYDMFGPVAMGGLAALTPFVVMTGMQVGTIPIAVSEITRVGKNRITAPAFMISNFTQAAACLAVAIKSKDKKRKALAYSCAFNAFVPGISEPAMYGITLKYRMPMLGAMVGALVGGVYVGMMQVGAYSPGAPNVFNLAVYVGKDPNNIRNMLIGCVLAIMVSFVATLLCYQEKRDTKDN